MSFKDEFRDGWEWMKEEMSSLLVVFVIAGICAAIFEGC